MTSSQFIRSAARVAARNQTDEKEGRNLSRVKVGLMGMIGQYLYISDFDARMTVTRIHVGDTTITEHYAHVSDLGSTVSMQLTLY